MTVKVRFAPSPTGLLHVGNARTALINWLYARQHKGVFLLRFDDTDLERTKVEYEDGIRQDLQWLGLTHDEEFRQRDQLDAYQKAIETLKAKGRLYPCYETPQELALKRKSQLARGQPPLYDRAALKVTQAQKDAFEKQGLKPHWRLLLTDKIVQWTDLVRGSVEFHGANLSDPVLLREDGNPIYTLSSVVDDIQSDITHIIRGEDHVANTAVQLQLVEALGADPARFTFAHLPLLTGSQGEGLSKRLGSLSLKNLREDGIEAMALNSFLAKLGTSDSIIPLHTLDELTQEFDVSHFSRSSPKFSVEALKTINEKFLHTLSYDLVKDRLPEIDEAFWLLVRENIATLADVHQWQAVCSREITPIIPDSTFIQIAHDTLSALPWNEETFKNWTMLLKDQTGKKGKELFMPLRLALTGIDHGPSLGDLLLRIGQEKSLTRLAGKKS